MVKEVLDGLNLKAGGTYIDGTLGLGGHTEAILAHNPDIKLVIGFEWDEKTYNLTKSRLASHGSKVTCVHASFTTIKDFLESREISGVDGILLDIGISSFLLEHSQRGFSFLKDEPLDMRMDQRNQITASDMVNNLPQNQLTELIRTLGEERWAKRIASHIVDARHKKAIETSKELAEIVFKAIPRRYHPRKIHPATRTFQALRIAVNRELDNLKAALETLADCLLPEGRLCIISFHSLEDRLVKWAFREDPRLKVITKKPLTASSEEIAQNPRARSAKLRIAERIIDSQKDQPKIKEG